MILHVVFICAVLALLAQTADRSQSVTVNRLLLNFVDVTIKYAVLPSFRDPHFEHPQLKQGMLCIHCMYTLYMYVNLPVFHAEHKI